MSTKTEYQALVRKAQELSDAYYNQDAPLVSDYEYDQLTQSIKAIEAEHPEWLDANSPSHKIGGKPAAGINKVRHLTRLTSLNDVFTIDDVFSWWHNRHDPWLVVEEKIDGLTIALTYQDGILIQAATRGDGEIGEDVTDTARFIPSIPKTIDAPKNSLVYVRGEANLTGKDFLAINQMQADANKPPFANPRNAAAGILRAHRSPYAVLLNIRMFALLKYDNITPAYDLSTEDGAMRQLTHWGFPTVEHRMAHTEREIQEAIDTISTKAAAGQYGYPIDGAAIKINTKDLQTELDAGGKYPLWAIAYKYPAEAKTTVIRDIKVTTGRTGVLTPVAIFDPIQLAGTTVSKATCHNQMFLNANRLNIGAKVTVIKSGEIIPKIDAVLEPAQNAFQIKTCPICGTKAVQATDENGNSDTIIMVCPNPACPAQLEAHLNFVCSKHCLDIRGMGPAKIAKLIEKNKLKSVAGLFGLTLQDFIDAGFTIDTSSKLHDAVQIAMHSDFERVFASLGIPGAGRTLGRVLAEHYPDMATLAAASAEELQTIDGIGSITATTIANWFQDISLSASWKAMQFLGVNMKSDRYHTGSMPPQNQSLPLKDLAICVTGAIPGHTRDSIGAYLAGFGAKVTSGVSKNTDILLCGDPAATSSKIRNAKTLGIPVFTLDQLQNKYLN